MTPLEIEKAVEDLISLPFDGEEFPFQFLHAFDTSDAAIKRLRLGKQNQSDVGGVLNRNNLHIATCEAGTVDAMFAKLRSSPKTASAKAKFIFATDGETFQAEDVISGATLAKPLAELPDHFGFFLPLAGITTVKEIRESSFDIKATGRLNRLYLELLKDNPEWATNERRPDMNHFMARLIFCFFAEDTDIFVGEGLFTSTVQQMSSSDSSDTHIVMSEIFRAMDCKVTEREAENIPRYANQFPYVNGELFSGDIDVPKFSKMARSYLIHIGGLDWTKINPDIFGSMIQAVADDEERGSLGMHYTSVPNILKVLNPLFLNDLRAKLEEAADNERKLLNLRKRIAKIRVFDPACGSGNFLVIAYKEMRAIEHEINTRRGEPDRKSDMPLTNFRGIELRDFPAEIARLALIIAEYQCDVTYCGQKEALANFLPLDSENWITCGNALRLDWLNICPPTGTGVKLTSDDLYDTPLDQSEIDFDNEGGELYLCGNPPYRGSKWLSPKQKQDMQIAWSDHKSLSKVTDFVSGWIAQFIKFLEYVPDATAAFVTTNSICQGQQASQIWSVAKKEKVELLFAHLPFKWNNLASHNAGVTVVIIGLGRVSNSPKRIFDGDLVRDCKVISPYLIADNDAIVSKAKSPLFGQSKMLFGNMPRDGGHLFLTSDEARKLKQDNLASQFVKKFLGSEELIRGKSRFCIWIEDNDIEVAQKSEFIRDRLAAVSENRTGSSASSTRDFAKQPHRFVQIAGKAEQYSIAVPRVSSENRDYLPTDLLTANTILGDRNFALYDAPLWNMAIIASRLHWVWIGTVCVRLEMRFSYSNTLGWNTFPVPKLIEQNKADLTRCAENILLAREAHYPATIADLYDPEKIPDDLRRAHDANDETLERIYIGRRFRNDTERLEKLFELYTKMTKGKAA